MEGVAHRMAIARILRVSWQDAKVLAVTRQSRATVAGYG